MMRENPRFRRHCRMLEDAIKTLPESMQVRGQELLNDMKGQAEMLDMVTNPEKVSPNSLGDSLKTYRDQFQLSCRNMHDWKKTHLPDLILD